MEGRGNQYYLDILVPTDTTQAPSPEKLAALRV
uniref:Uncharacterized protein n=1 Tax=Microviridae sp. ctemt10 TaxID=2827647 RepID=A0A8S5TMP5_9VIRU|nr:MAG TPA: hypothetical protein [Microviridae sp. ctemt10]DAH71734.1 MAG TPA: hypothetical protein [Microviridae sp.]